MDDNILKILVYVLGPLLVGGIGFLIKSTLGRIDMLESEIVTKVSRAEMREAVEDRLLPLREDIHDLKDKVDKIYDFMINNQVSKKL